MLKNKYQRMSKEEKKVLRKEFADTPKGKSNNPRLLRVLVIGIFCFFYAIYLAIDTYINNSGIIFYIYSILIFLASVIFLISYFNIKGKMLNKFALEKTKKRK